jgi:hypothetical protein
MHKQPFVQGITSASEIGERVAEAILADVAGVEVQGPLQVCA